MLHHHFTPNKIGRIGKFCVVYNTTVTELQIFSKQKQLGEVIVDL